MMLPGTRRRIARLTAERDEARDIAERQRTALLELLEEIADLESDVARASDRAASDHALALRHQVWAENCHTRMSATEDELRAIKFKRSRAARVARQAQLGQQRAMVAHTSARLRNGRPSPMDREPVIGRRMPEACVGQVDAARGPSEVAA